MAKYARLKLVVALCILAVIVSVTAFAETVTTYVDVNENEVIKASEKGLIGMGDTWDTWRLYLGDSESTETSQRFLDMMHEYQIPMLQQRMSGADTMDLYWKETLGDMSERGDGSPYSRNMGIVEWIKSVTAVNKDAYFTLAINIVNDTPENHADLVRFLTLMPDDAKAVGNDGTNWAQKRVELGIPEPVNIRLFELGNEVYGHYAPVPSDHTLTYEEGVECANKYIADCREAIDAMKAVNPDIKFAMCGYSRDHGRYEAGIGWNRRILEMLSDDCEYMVDHKYFYDYNNDFLEGEMRSTYTDLIDELPEEKRPTLYFSEYGCWVEGASAENAMEYLPWPTSLKGALTDAKFLNGWLINCPYVSLSALFCTSGAQINTATKWGAGFSFFRIFDDGEIYATVPAEMLKIFNEAVGTGQTGENVVKTTLSVTVRDGVRDHSYIGGWGNNVFRDELNPKPTPGLMTVSSHTTKDGGLNMILVNPNETVGHTIVPTFKKQYKLREELILTSASLDDNNIPGSNDTVYTKRYIVNSENKFESHYIPPKSVVVLKLVPESFVYPAAKNTRVSFVNGSGEVDGIPAVGTGSFGIACEFYDNKNMASLERAVLAIPKKGITAQSVADNFGANLQNLCYLGQADVKRNIAYFDIGMGDAPAGVYQVVFGNFESGMYEIIDFYYRGADDSEKIINKVYFENAANDSNLISNNEYFVDTKISFNENFDGGEPCRITVVSSEDIIANTGYITAVRNGYGEYEFYMPKDAINGKYILEIEYTDNNGGIVTEEAEFEFVKPNELLTLAATVKSSTGTQVTYDNICEADALTLSVSNTEDKSVDFKAIVAFYGKDKQLLYAAVSERGTASAEPAEVQVSLSDMPEGMNVDHITVYIFDDFGNLVPQSNVYYIK